MAETTSTNPAVSPKLGDTRPTGRSAVVVLGMHRAGTSALAGILAKSGCATAATGAAPDSNNLKGYFDSSPIWALSDEILATYNDAWDGWDLIPGNGPSGPQGEAFAQRARQIIEDEFAGKTLLLIKEPRLCRLAPFWFARLASLDIRPCPVLILRNPLEVAASLSKRNGFSSDYSVLAWLGHMLCAERDTRGRARAFTDYSEVLDSPRKVVTRIAETFDIPLAPEAIQKTAENGTLLDRRLRHYVTSDQSFTNHPAIPAVARDVFATFKRWMRTGENPADYAALDSASSLLHDIAGLAGNLIDQGHRAIETQRLAVAAARDDAQRDHESMAMELASMRSRETEMLNALKAAREKLELMTAALKAAQGLRGDRHRAGQSGKHPGNEKAHPDNGLGETGSEKRR